MLESGISIYDMNLRVVFYARVSTEHEEQASSIVNQVSYFRNYIKNYESWNFVGSYVDEG